MALHQGIAFVSNVSWSPLVSSLFCEDPKKKSSILRVRGEENHGFAAAAQTIQSPPNDSGSGSVSRRSMINGFLASIPASVMPTMLSNYVAETAMAAVSGTVIKMGSDEGALVFVPSSVSVSAGEKVTFVNNKGFPHNVVFEKDGVPENVQTEQISHEDYMNDQGEQFFIVLKEIGTYRYFCEPHRSAGMYGEIIVN